MIDNYDGFLESIKNNTISDNISWSSSKVTLSFKEGYGELFCPNCGDLRRCLVSDVVSNFFIVNKETDEVSFQSPLPFLFRATCLQCQNESLLILYKGPEKIELVVLHSSYSGCVTPHTPNEVKYYIDQAFKARSVGAISAAMAMYRSALEWLLYGQGFKDGMLAQKIKELEVAIKNKNAPKWAMEIETEFLAVIKDIGNGAMHTNGGDITKQSNIDKSLIELIDVIFTELLDKIYEQPIRSAENLAKLKAKASAVK